MVSKRLVKKLRADKKYMKYINSSEHRKFIENLNDCPSIEEVELGYKPGASTYYLCGEVVEPNCSVFRTLECKVCLGSDLLPIPISPWWIRESIEN